MFKDMKAYAHLKPGQKGTLRLVEKYGALLCVRYRYDARRRMRLKTVEIIVKEKAGSHRFPFRNDDIVSVMVPYAEKTCVISSKLREAGGTLAQRSGGCVTARFALWRKWLRESYGNEIDEAGRVAYIGDLGSERKLPICESLMFRI
ncbi:MAG: hypothetical protein VB050_13010 [Geobacteraceae bacterium]|nr:hypothetical protein [Geobacteraceae bacterium]